MSVTEAPLDLSVPDWQTKRTSLLQKSQEKLVAKYGQAEYDKAFAQAQAMDQADIAAYQEAQAAIQAAPRATPRDYATAYIEAARAAKTPRVKKKLVEEARQVSEAIRAYNSLKDTFDASYGDPKRAQAEFAARGDQMQGTLGAVLGQLSFPAFLQDYRDARKQAGDPEKAVRMTRLALGMQDLADSAGGAAAVRYQLGLPDMAAGEKLFRQVQGKVPNAEALKDKIVAFGEAQHAYEDIAANMETYAQQYVQAHPGTSFDEGIKAIQDVLAEAQPKVAALAKEMPEGVDRYVPPLPHRLSSGGGYALLERTGLNALSDVTHGPITGPIARMLLPEGPQRRLESTVNLVAPPQERTTLEGKVPIVGGLIPTNYAASISALNNALAFSALGGLSLAGKAGAAATGLATSLRAAPAVARLAGAATAGAVGAAEVPATIEAAAHGRFGEVGRNILGGAALGGVASGAKTGLAGPRGRATMALESTTPTVRARAEALQTTPPEVGQAVARRAEQLQAPVPQPRTTRSRNFAEEQRQAKIAEGMKGVPRSLGKTPPRPLGEKPKAGAVEPGAVGLTPPKLPSAAPAKTQAAAELPPSAAPSPAARSAAAPPSKKVLPGVAETVPPKAKPAMGEEAAAAAAKLNKALKKTPKPPPEPPPVPTPGGLPAESIAKMQEKIAALKAEKPTKPKLKPPSKEPVVYRIDYESASGERKVREFTDPDKAAEWVVPQARTHDVKLNKAATELRDKLAAERVAAHAAAEAKREAAHKRASDIYASVNEKVAATKFKRESFTIPAKGDIPAETVTGPSSGGLIVQKYSDRFPKYGITHLASGKRIIGGHWETQGEAKKALVRLLDVTDWTKPEEDVVKAVTGDVFRAKIAPLLNDLYADVEQPTPQPTNRLKPPRKPKAKSLGAAAYQRGMGGVGIPRNLVGTGEVVVKGRPPTGTRFVNPPPPPKPPTLRSQVAEVAGIPREVMTTLDIGAVGRQGLPLVLSHPIKAAKVFGPALRDMIKEKTFRALPDEIIGSRNYGTYRKMKLAIPILQDLEHNISGKEERFATGLAQRFLSGETKVSPRGIPVIGKAARGVGELMHGSKRFHESFLSRLRTSVADGMIDKAEKIAAKDTKFNWEKFYERSGRFVNAWSGRGNLGSLEEAAGDLSTALWSPRLLASHAQRLNPLEYIRMDKVTRQEAIRANLAIAGTVTSIGAMVKLYRDSLPPSERDQVDFGLDPLSSDFGKLRIGKTRIDFTGGHGQYIRLLAQAFSGKTVSSTTGRKTDTTIADILGRFGRGKVSPAMSYAADVASVLRGHFTKKMPTDFDGRPISVPKKTLDLFTAMVAQNVLEIAKTDPSLLPLSIFDVAGFSTNTYPTNTTRAMDSASRLLATSLNKRDEERAQTGKPTSKWTQEQRAYAVALAKYKKALKEGAPKQEVEAAKLAADTAARRVLGKEGWE